MGSFFISWWRAAVILAPIPTCAAAQTPQGSTKELLFINTPTHYIVVIFNQCPVSGESNLSEWSLRLLASRLSSSFDKPTSGNQSVLNWNFFIFFKKKRLSGICIHSSQAGSLASLSENHSKGCLAFMAWQPQGLSQNYPRTRSSSEALLQS